MDYQFVDYGEELKALLKKIFTSEFMQKHTRFQSFEGFQYSSAVFLNWNSEQLLYSKTAFDYFVRESTQFPTWDAMVQSAADSFFAPDHDID